MLELGSFAGGISAELLKTYPDFRLTIADENSEYLRHLHGEFADQITTGCMRLLETDLGQLNLPDGSFDLVVLRGAFFFIMTRPSIMNEIYRVLKPGAIAFVGGGYGKDVPSEIIDEIAEESRILNDRLGRRRVSIEELKELLLSVGLSGQAQIVEEGGVWLLLRKQTL